MIRIRSIQLHLPSAYRADAAMIGRAAGQAIGQHLLKISDPGANPISLNLEAGGLSSLALVSKIGQAAKRNLGGK